MLVGNKINSYNVLSRGTYSRHRICTLPMRATVDRQRSRLIKQLLTCEQLEARQLMASDLEAVQSVGNAEVSTNARKFAPLLEEQLVLEKPTHAYYADGQPVSMVVNPASLAIKLASGVDESALGSFGLEYERKLNDAYAVYSSIDSSVIDRQQLMESGLVADTVSVFFAQESRSEAVVLDEVIVALKPGTTAEEYFTSNQLFSSYQHLLGTPDQFIARVADGAGEIALHVANAIGQDSRLQFASPNLYQNWQRYFIPNDPRFPNQWHLHNTGQGGGLVDADVDMPEAWDINQGGSSSIVIGVIDDGVAAHADLDLWRNTGELEEGFDNDNNGWVDDINGWNFVNNNSSSDNTQQTDMHGTAVAGVAAARGNNGVGVAGASYNSKVLSAKIFEGSAIASDANIAGALYYTAGRTADGLGTWRAADVVNNSWGGGANSTVINAALTWGVANGNLGKGVAFLFATGNGFGAVSQPALQSLNIPGVFAIGATNNKAGLSDYSNTGPAVDMVAPSNDTRSGYLAIDTTDRQGQDNGYDPTGDYTGTGATGFGGTSSATPLATGIAAVTLAQAAVQNVILTPAQLRSYLRTNTEYIGNAVYDPVTGKNNSFGYGRINAFSAVSNLGKPEISVLSATEEVQSGGTLAVGNAYVDEFVDLVVRVRNQGTLPLVLGTLNVGTGPFTLLSGLGSTTLALGEATTFSVRFTPTAGGTVTQSVTINSNDTSEAAFTFNLSGVGLAPNISGFVFEDWDGDNVKETPPDVSKSNHTVYIDTNNNGSLDSLPTTFTNTTSAPLVDAGVMTSTIAVTGMTSVVADVNVRLNLTHTWMSDLRISLISPSGTTIILANRIGGSTDNLTNTILDDEATTTIAAAVAPRTGSFRPSEPLSAFDNALGNGTWTLQIEDLAADDTGSLLDWDLVLSTSEPQVSTRANGAYGLLDVPVGSHTVRVLPPSGWSVANNTTYNVTVAAPTDMIRNRDFGIGENNRFYSMVFNDFNLNGIWDTTETGITGAQLLDDLNNNGVADATAPLAFSVSPALSIPDLTTRTSTVTASGVDGVVTDVNVKVNFTMTFDGDLDVFLLGPDGTRVELFTDVGGAGANFTNTILDDQAATAITAGTAPFTGSFRPEGTLSSFNGKSGNGTWTLEVSDDASGDVATLTNWELTVTGGEPTIGVPASGYGSTILSAGTHNMKVLPPVGFRNTLPNNGLRTVNVAGAPVFDQRYGLRPNNTAPTNIGLSANTVQENLASGTTVGAFSSTDPDFGDTFTYALVAGAGSTDNGQFTIDSSGNLKTAASFNFEAAASLSIRVSSTDQDGAAFEKNFTIIVTDIVEMSGGAVLGGGSLQRSFIDKVEMTFDGATTFEAGAFTVDKRGAGGGAVTTTLTTASNGAGQTVATLTFSGAFTRGTSGLLSDGYYQLTVDGSKVRRGSQTLDINGDGVGGDTYVLGAVEADNFFALYGDTTGDGLVGVAEFGQFRNGFGKTSAQPGYNGQFDFENDGTIGVGDFGQFRSRFGKPKIVFS